MAAAANRGSPILARRLAQFAGTLTVVIGLVHGAVGVSTYARFTFDALWFQGSGLAGLLIGALTLLAASERAWRTLLVVAGLANAGDLALAVAFGVLSGWKEPQGPLLIAVFALGLVASPLGLRGRTRRAPGP